MTDPTSANILLALPLRGSDVGVWDLPINGNSTALDGYFGGVQVISVSGSSFTLSAPSGVVTAAAGPTQAQNAVLRITGTLTSNVQITLPLPGYYIIDTTGLNGFSFVLTFRAVGSGLVIGMPFGAIRHIYNDATNVYHANLPDVGAYMDLATSTAPGWIAACSTPPWLLCNGSTFNATTYPVLNNFLGGNTLPDARGRSRYMLGLGTGRLTSAGAGIDGTTLLAAGGGNGVNLAVNQVPSLSVSGTITVNPVGNSALTVPYKQLAAAFNGAFNFGNPGGSGNVVAATDSSGWGQTSSFTGGNTLTYTNNSQAIIGSTTQGYAGGLTFIRAG